MIGRKENSTSEINQETILDYIDKKYNPFTKSVHIRRGEFSDIYIETSSIKNEFTVKTPIRFMPEDVIKLVEEMLTEQNVPFEPTSGRFGSPIRVTTMTVDETEEIVYTFNWRD